MDRELLDAIGRMLDEKLEQLGQKLEQKLEQKMDQKLEALEQKMDQKLDQKLKPINEQLAELKESQEEIRSAVNALLGWAEDVSNTITFPLPRIGNG